MIGLSEVTGGLTNNGTSMGNGSDFTHTVNNTGQGGMPQNKDILDTKIHNHFYFKHPMGGGQQQKHSAKSSKP